MDYSKTARHNMIDGQLAPGTAVDPRVTAAFGVTPREKFVPELYQRCAYVDEDLPLGNGRYLMQPLTLGLMVQEAQIKEGENALVIGGSTGYSSMVLSHLGCKVTMVEEQRELADAARRIFSELGAGNVKVQMGGLQAGHKTGAPYDVILIDGAVEYVPDTLIKQLAEGGRLVAIICQNTIDVPTVSGVGQVMVMTKQGEQLHSRVVGDASVPVLPPFVKEDKFVL